MSNEFVYIVLDIGSRFIRGGIAGNELPTATIINNGYLYQLDEEIIESTTEPPDETYSIKTRAPPYLQLDDHALTQGQLKELREKLSDPIKQLNEIYKEDCGNWLDLCQNDYSLKLHEHMLQLFEQFPLMLSKCRIIILDDKFSLIDKFKLSRILLIRIGVKSLQFIPSNILSIVSSKQLNGNGFLIEFTWNSFKVSSIIDFRVLNCHEDPSKLTGINLHYRIVEELIKLNHKILKDENCFIIIEKLLANHAYCGDTVDGNFEMDGYEFPNYLRNEIITSMVLDIVDVISNLLILNTSGLSMDAVKILRENILFDGGISNIPGIKTRILKYLRHNLSRSILAHKCLGAWQGGSIYCSTSILKRSRNIRKSEELTKETIKGLANDQGVQLSKMPDVLNYQKVIT